MLEGTKKGKRAPRGRKEREGKKTGSHCLRGSRRSGGAAGGWTEGRWNQWVAAPFPAARNGKTERGAANERTFLFAEREASCCVLVNCSLLSFTAPVFWSSVVHVKALFRSPSSRREEGELMTEENDTPSGGAAADRGAAPTQQQ